MKFLLDVYNYVQKHLFFYFARGSIVFFLLVASVSQAALQWQSLAPGLEYSHIPLHFGPTSQLHLVRIDPKRFRLEIVPATQIKQKRAFVRTIATKTNAILAINGGYFDSKDQMLGLRYSGFQQLNPLRPISWWSIFLMDGQRPQLVHNAFFKHSSKIDFAIQAGPRLIINGRMTSNLRPGFAERTGICVDSRGQVLIAVTEHAPITTNEFAHLLLKPPLSRGGPGCVQALNLDGGSSSQLYLNTRDLQIDVVAFSPVTDAVVIRRR